MKTLFDSLFVEKSNGRSTDSDVTFVRPLSGEDRIIRYSLKNCKKMNLIMKFLTTVSVSIVLFACSHTVVSQTPAISVVYTDEQIDAMIESYHAASDRDVIAPEVISRAFVGHFPNARDIDWEVSNNIYKVDFDIRVTDYEAWYDASGNLLMYIFDVRVSSLPAVVKNAVSQKYPKFRIDDVEKFYQGSVAGYKVKVEKGKIEYEAWFREDGTFIRERLD